MRPPAPGRSICSCRSSIARIISHRPWVHHAVALRCSPTAPTIDPASLPAWARPCTVLSMKDPRSHARARSALPAKPGDGDVRSGPARFSRPYRAVARSSVSRADSDNFSEEAWQPAVSRRRRGAGAGARRNLVAAAEKTARFRAIYDDLETASTLGFNRPSTGSSRMSGAVCTAIRQGHSGGFGSSPRPRRGASGEAAIIENVHCTRATLRARP